MEISAFCEQNPPLIPSVAASKPPADTYYSFNKSKMFLQRCWFRSVCRAADKTRLVTSQRKAETVKAPLLFYFVMTTEAIKKI